MQKIIHRTYKFRLYPNKQQVTELENLLLGCRKVYNRTMKMLSKESKYTPGAPNVRRLVEIRPKALQRYIANTHYAWASAAIIIAERRAEVYWKRRNNGDKVGRPRNKTKIRYNTAPWTDSAVMLHAKHVLISGINGHIKSRIHRSIPEDAEDIMYSFKRHNNKWYLLVAFSKYIKPVVCDVDYNIRR